MTTFLRFLLAFPGCLWSGYVVSVLWGWYLEPIGAPHLSVIRAVGIGVTLHALRAAPIPAHKPTGVEYTPGELLFMSLILWGLAPAFSLALGWFWRWWL